VLLWILRMRLWAHLMGMFSGNTWDSSALPQVEWKHMYSLLICIIRNHWNYRNYGYHRNNCNNGNYRHIWDHRNNWNHCHNCDHRHNWNDWYCYHLCNHLTTVLQVPPQPQVPLEPLELQAQQEPLVPLLLPAPLEQQEPLVPLLLLALLLQQVLIPDMIVK
jgi:hypothetical protein